MAKAKKQDKKTPLEPLSKKGRKGYTLKVPDEMTFEDLIKLAVTTPKKDKAKKQK